MDLEALPLFVSEGVRQLCSSPPVAVRVQLRRDQLQVDSKDKTHRGGLEGRFQRCYRKMDSILSADRVSECQEVLKRELDRLKTERKRLRKDMKDNQKQARNATKRKQRLLKVGLICVFLLTVCIVGYRPQKGCLGQT